MSRSLRTWSAAAVFIIVSVGLAIAVGGAILCEGALRVPPRKIPSTPLAILGPAQAQDIHDWRAVSISGADGAALRGWLLFPPAANGGYVMVLHGIADSRLGQLGLADLFLRHHYAVLLPDSRGHGVSGGGLVTYGLRERDDVRRWFDWLESTEHPRNIYGFGESLGGSVLLESLMVEPHFSAVIAECPYASFARIAEYRVAQQLRAPEWLAAPGAQVLVWSGFLYARLRYGLNFWEASAAEPIARTSVPVLLIHGLADSRTPAVNSELLAARNPDHVKLWLVPHARHTGAYQTAPVEFERRVIGWVSRHAAMSAAGSD